MLITLPSGTTYCASSLSQRINNRAASNEKSSSFSSLKSFSLLSSCGEMPSSSTTSPCVDVAVSQSLSCFDAIPGKFPQEVRFRCESDRILRSSGGEGRRRIALFASNFRRNLGGNCVAHHSRENCNVKLWKVEGIRNGDASSLGSCGGVSGRKFGNSLVSLDFKKASSVQMWKLEASKSGENSNWSSEGGVAAGIENKFEGNEESGFLLDSNGQSRGGAATSEVESGAIVTKNIIISGQAPAEYDGFYNRNDPRWIDAGIIGGVSRSGENEDLMGAKETGRVEIQSGDKDSYWGVGQENDVGKTVWTSASTGFERTEEILNETEETSRFRLRNGREVFEERAYLVGIDQKGGKGRALFGIKDSLEELTQLADTAGLAVVGSTYQKLESPNPRTYIGGGKVSELKAAIQAFNVETVIFDDELSPGQARSLEKIFGKAVRVCDRTALILDIFSQRAATREAALQVELAQFEYQLPRLTKMWSHLERQAGGMVKGMGEKQIEVDKRILRTRMAALRKDLESVREHRQQYRDRRAAVPIPVLSLVGYTNAGKSTFLNRLSGANVLAEDRLFATLDPTTRRVELPSGKECLFTDTVGFIQKLPTQLVAAFRATLEEITDSSLMLHMVDISHPMADQQMEAVNSVLADLNVNHIPMITVWNKIDRAQDRERLRAEASAREDVVCISALTGEGMDDFYNAIDQKIKDLLVWVEATVPYGQGDLIDIIHRLGIVDQEEYTEQGTVIKAHVPLALSRQLLPLRHVPV